MKIKKTLLVLILVTLISISFTSLSKGLQTEKIETDTDIEMIIENDGSYEIKSNSSLENFPEIMIMVENLNLQTDIEKTEGNKIEINPDSKIKFDNKIGLYLLNEFLKTAIPGKVTNFIPEDMRSFIGGFIDLEKLNEEPIQLLNLMSLPGATTMLNNNLLRQIEGETVENLIQKYNLEGKIPPNIKNYIPNIEIEEIKITNYSWKNPVLKVKFKIILSEGTEDIQKFTNALPLKIDFSYLSSYSPSLEAEAGVKVDSEAPLPGYNKGKSWSIKPPSKVNQMLEDTGIWEKEGGIIFKLKTPKTAELHNLPKNYEKIDNTTYQWTGEEGKKAIRSIVENESLEIELEEGTTEENPLKNPPLWVIISALVAIISLIGAITIIK